MNERAPTEGVDLERRAAPRQKRSQDRILKIVAATKVLLVRGDVDAITTSTVAAEAGVPVSSVYRYFPNIYSIHRTILEELKAETDRIVTTIMEDPDEQDWTVSLSGMIFGLRQLVASNPSYGAVFRLTLTTHELRAVREAWNLRLAGFLADRWRQGLDGFHGGDPDVVARMTVEIYCAAEVLIFETRDRPADAEIYFIETLAALQRYLAPYLD
ncbi:TetR/AcrR family transcriptional regulator [Maricaulis sp.]|uniref:TetR/AcrR family transcriptional regulator n=1 Tax=Maricaulis sp. TaxID=1486257 RepID=UPI002608385E|nr:TetR/AcrR family transcriptional regulator [Maricaulis sp.]MDF1768335.1 TetR/AcrR family transcriptional regulator [Maricaulis sp.]